MASTIKIKGVKILKAKKKHPEKVALTYTETKLQKEGNSHHEREEECDAPPHQDFKDALQGLAVHLALQMDYVSEKNAKNKELIEKFTVTSYSLSGEDLDNLVITGQIATKRGSAGILNTPLFRMGMTDQDDYMLIKHLESQIEKCNSEAISYLVDGKHGPKPQKALDFDQDGKEDE